MLRFISIRSWCRFGLAALPLMLAPATQAAEGDIQDGVVAKAIPIQTNWVIRLPTADKPVFKGALGGIGNHSDAGAMLYPAPNLAGFIAAVVTHGVLTNSAQSAKHTKEQEEADKVLTPYQQVLGTMTLSKIARQGLEKSNRSGTKRLASPMENSLHSEWVIESSAIFTMTQDERALVLDNAFVVRSPENPATVFYKNLVRVVAAPKPAGDEQSPLAAQWLANNGQWLQQESAGLWAESLEVVLSELARGPSISNAPQKTVRFWEGGTRKFERASLIEERCDRLTLKTLRGWLLSVPTKADAFGTPSCELVNPPTPLN